jgi:hypothetical protein
MTVPGILPHFPSRSECVIADMLAAQASARGEHPFVDIADETWT